MNNYSPNYILNMHQHLESILLAKSLTWGIIFLIFAFITPILINMLANKHEQEVDYNNNNYNNQHSENFNNRRNYEYQDQYNDNVTNNTYYNNFNEQTTPFQSSQEKINIKINKRKKRNNK